MQRLGLVQVRYLGPPQPGWEQGQLVLCSPQQAEQLLADPRAWWQLWPAEEGDAPRTTSPGGVTTRPPITLSETRRQHPAPPQAMAAHPSDPLAADSHPVGAAAGAPPWPW